MKKMKRDLSTRAFNRGYQIGNQGKSRDLCPHDNGDMRQHWLSGWREGRSDQWDGYTGVAGIHRMGAHL